KYGVRERRAASQLMPRRDSDYAANEQHRLAGAPLDALLTHHADDSVKETVAVLALLRTQAGNPCRRPFRATLRGGLVGPQRSRLVSQLERSASIGGGRPPAAQRPRLPGGRVSP